MPGSSFLKKAALFGISTAFVAVTLLVAEFGCRAFTNINFLDNSRGMFTPDRFGNSYGNTPNFEGISFGEPFRTDENGFRVGLDGPRPSRSSGPALLILGDSVGFGPAVPEEKTIAGLLRSRMDRQVHNASVIGYGTFDYLNAGSALVETKPEIDQVFVLFCLNDVSDASAGNIRREVAGAAEPEATGAYYFLRLANDYLRSRSKLYLLLKNLLRDTQMVYFRSTLASYQHGRARLDAALTPVSELNDRLRGRGVRLTIFVFPNEAQLRPGSPDDFRLPQRLLSEQFRDREIDFVDLTPVFEQSGRSSKELFLYGDPMHLSEVGMRVAADAICQSTRDCKMQ